MSFSSSFADVFRAVSGARLGNRELDQRERMVALDEALQPLRLQREQLGLQADRFRLEKIAPLEEAIASLNKQQAALNLKASRFAAGQQAALTTQFPILGMVNQLQPAVVGGITTLAAMDKEAKDAAALLEQKNKGLSDLITQLKGLQNEQKALQLDAAASVETVLGSLEADNPGLTFTPRERAGLADLAAQYVDSGSISLEQLPDALQGFLANNPRVQSRLGSIVPLTAEVAPAAAVPSAIQQLQAITQRGISSIGDVLSVSRAQQQVQAEQQTAAAEQARLGVLEWIRQAALSGAAEPGLAATVLRQHGVESEEQLLGLDIQTLQSIKDTISLRAQRLERGRMQQFK